MLAAMASPVVSAATPLAPPGGYLKVTHVSATTNGSIDWSKIWDVTNVDRLGCDFENEVEIIGQFEKPTKVTDIIFTSQYYHARLNGITVSLSVDGKEWRQVLAISGESGSSWYKQYSYGFDAGSTEYSYIRLAQSTKNSSFSNKYTFDCPFVAVYDNSAANIDDALTGKLNVTHVSASDNGVDWSKAWDEANTTRLGYQFATPVEIVGQFDEPTRVTDIVFCSVYYHSRLNGITVSLSVDGKEWVEALAIKGQSSSGSYFPLGFSLNSGNTQYSYVKLSQTTANGEGQYPFDITWVSLYNCRSAALEEITHVSNAGTGDASKVWDFDNTQYVSIGDQASGTAMATGKFSAPTVIDTVYLNLHKNYEARNNGSTVEASVDGESWVKLGTVTTMTSGSDSATGTDFVAIHVDDDTAYSYIRLVKNNTYWWTMYSIGVEGEAHPELSERIKLAGFQRSTATDGTYSLRLICTANSAELDNVGMKLVCGADNGQIWTFDAEAYKFDTITAGDTTISASDKGAATFYTAVISDIPSDVGLFSVTATPYYSDGDIVRKQGTRTVIMNGTDAQSSKTYVLDEITDKLKISGRSSELDSGIACDFTASGIEFNATLAGNVRLKVDCSAATYYTLYLNGERQERLKFDAGVGEYIIARNLPANEYDVKLVKQTHVAHSTSTLLELTAYGDISADVPAENDLYIEFIGDSITCGYGVVGYPTAGVTYYGTSEFCDSTEAYAYKTATALGADYSMISVSGWAMLEGSSCIPSIYDKTCFKRGDAKYTPDRGADIVVINLGTNDYNYDTFETNFVDEYVDFVTDQVLAFNPDAKIVLAYGMMHKDDKLTNIEAKINTIVNELGGADFGFYAVKLDYNQDAGNGHPSADGHTVAAKTLTDFIKANCL